MDDITILRQFWPKSPHGSIITTSRNPLSHEEGFATCRIPIRPFDTTEGSAFLSSFLYTEAESKQNENERLAVKALVEYFAGLPIGLRVVAACIRRKHYSPSKFLALYKDQMGFIDHVNVPGTDKTLQTLWNISLNSISVEASSLLDTIAFLDPDEIPMELFEPSPSHSDSSTCHHDARKFHDALSSLTGHSLVVVNDKKQTISINRYFQSVVFANVAANDARYDEIFHAVAK